MIRILELFGGIGACSKALERLEIDYEIAVVPKISSLKHFNVKVLPINNPSHERYIYGNYKK